MTGNDYVVLLFYVLGVFAVGVGLSLKVKKTDDLFTAGGRSPWWASGLSGFMTMFSAARSSSGAASPIGWGWSR